MFETFTAAITLIVFVVPGYVWRTVEGQFIYLDRRLEWQKFALGLLARSTAVYAIFATSLYHAWRGDWLDNHPWRSTIVAISMIGIMPIFCGAAFGIARQKRIGWSIIRWFGYQTFEQHQIPTAWDYIFSTITPRWAIVTLKGGSKVYGFVGRSSYFSSDPDARDIFISQTLKPLADGQFEAVKDSAGVYINKDEISLIEFIYSEV